MNLLFTRNRAEAWREANRTPAPAKLSAFLGADPRPLPLPAEMPTPGMDAGARLLGLYGLGAVAFGVLGWVVSHL